MIHGTNRIFLSLDSFSDPRMESLNVRIRKSESLRIHVLTNLLYDFRNIKKIQLIPIVESSTHYRYLIPNHILKPRASHSQTFLFHNTFKIWGPLKMVAASSLRT
jgi:hypothetical protein